MAKIGIIFEIIQFFCIFLCLFVKKRYLCGVKMLIRLLLLPWLLVGCVVDEHHLHLNICSLADEHMLIGSRT